MAKLIERVREKGVEVELTEDARTLLGNLGYDPTYGARPLKRVIQKQLVDKLALKLLDGEFAPGDRVLVDAADGAADLRQGRHAGAVPARHRMRAWKRATSPCSTHAAGWRSARRWCLRRA